MGNLEKNRKRIINAVFVLFCCGILTFLLLAPEETTSPLPKDDNHLPFYDIASKKVAEQGCSQCHGENKEVEFSPEHPPKYRCLFCHKRK